MEKFRNIIEEIHARYKNLAFLKAEQEKLIDAWYGKIADMSLKERVKYRQEHEQEKIDYDKAIAEITETIMDERIKIQLLKNNAKLALYSEVLPVILEILEKWNGKPYGKKTEEKIHNEMTEKTNCRCHLLSHKILINPLNNRDYDIEICTRYIDGKEVDILTDNKIQAVNTEDLYIAYINKNYVEDLNATTTEMKRLHKLALEKEKELEEIYSSFNDLTVDGINDLSMYRRTGNTII